MELRYSPKSPEGAEKRFLEAYQSNVYGKGIYVKQALAAGHMLKEAGLLEFFLTLDTEEYVNMTPQQRQLVIGKRLAIACGVQAGDVTIDAGEAAQESSGTDTKKEDKPAPKAGLKLKTGFGQ